MTLNEYFKQVDTPAENSPVGAVMAKVLEKYPALSFDQARVKANDLIQESAGKRRFTLPRVLSEAELVDQKERLKAAWGPRRTQIPNVSSTTLNDIAA